jgi:hypothetical protein
VLLDGVEFGIPDDGTTPTAFAAAICAAYAAKGGACA